MYNPFKPLGKFVNRATTSLGKLVPRRATKQKHWVPSFLYLDEDLLLDIYSDATGELPKEIVKGGKSVELSSPPPVSARAGTSGATTKYVFKRCHYLQELIEKERLDRFDGFGEKDHGILGTSYSPEIIISSVWKEADWVEANSKRPDNQIWLRYQCLEFTTLRSLERKTEAYKRRWSMAKEPNGDKSSIDESWKNCLVIAIRAPSVEQTIRPLCIISLDKSGEYYRRAKDTPLDKIMRRAIDQKSPSG